MRPTIALRVVALATIVLSAAACGDDDSPDNEGTSRTTDAVSTTTAIESLSDEARPTDPSAAEVLEKLGLSDLPSLGADVVQTIQADRASEPWYQDGPAGVHAGHEHDDAASHAAIEALDEEERAVLDEQLARAQAAALKYPTFGEAHAAGFRAIGPAVPGLGVHAVQFRTQADADFHIDHPGVLMYRDTKPDAPVVGMLYLTRAQAAPEGFVGSADQWHEHLKVCIRSAGDEIEILSVDNTKYAKSRCLKQDGVFFGESGWMLHVWPVDEWTPPEGVFSDDNSLVVPRA
jgi:hypothetical protein